MSTEETTILNEPTARNEKNEQQEPQGQQGQVQSESPETSVTAAPEPVDRPAERTSTGQNMWKQVLIGGVNGILFGGTSILLRSAMSAIDDPDAPTAGGNHADGPVPVSEDVNITVEGLPVATVSDDMTFSEAFAAARAEVGAGGVFEWHGGVYGTYYANEWNSMTAEEQQAFGAHLSYNASSSNASSSNISSSNSSPSNAPSSHSQQTGEHQAQQSSSHLSDTTDEEEGDLTGHGNGEHSDESAGNGQHSSGNGSGEEPAPEPDGDVQILGVGEATLSDGTTVTVGQASIDGQDVYVYDIDQDGIFDVMGTDVNQDGEISVDELFDIQDQNIHVSAFQQNTGVAEEPSSLYADNDLPDYTNDADPSSFA